MPLQNSGVVAHKISIGRYSKIYNEETKRYQQLPREIRTCDTCKDKVEEVVYSGHFLPYFTGGLIHLTVQLLFSTVQLL